MKAVIKILFPKSIAIDPIADMTKNAVGEGGYNECRSEIENKKRLKTYWLQS